MCTVTPHSSTRMWLFISTLLSTYTTIYVDAQLQVRIDIDSELQSVRITVSSI